MARRFFPARRFAEARPLRVHVGCGTHRLEGWVNVDRKRLDGVDVVADVRRGLPFSDADAIFAEHFLEHLSVFEARRFLAECRRALGDAGVLRISTPNLDWVVESVYRGETPLGQSPGVSAAFDINRAFRAWGHRFLYNRAALEALLTEAGFSEVRFERYGESERAGLAGLESHERNADRDDLPHVLVAEASGRTSGARLDRRMLEDYERDLLDGIADWKKPWIRRFRRLRRPRE